MATSAKVLTLQPGERRKFDMPFGGLMRDGDTIAAISGTVTVAGENVTLGVSQANQGRVTGSDDLTITSPAYDGQTAQARFEGGTDGEDYLITFRVQTTAGDVLEAEGWIYVRDLTP